MRGWLSETVLINIFRICLFSVSDCTAAIDTNILRRLSGSNRKITFLEK